MEHDVYENKTGFKFYDIQYNPTNPVDFDCRHFPLIRNSRIKWAAYDEQKIVNEIAATAICVPSLRHVKFIRLTKTQYEPAIIGRGQIGFRISFSGCYSGGRGRACVHLTASRWYKTPDNVKNGNASGSMSDYGKTVFSYIDYMTKTRKMIWHPLAGDLDRKQTTAKWKIMLKTP